MSKTSEELLTEEQLYEAFLDYRDSANWGGMLSLRKKIQELDYEGLWTDMAKELTDAEFIAFTTYELANLEK